MPLLSFKPHCTFPLPQVLQKMRQGVEFQNMAPGGYLVCVFGWEGALSYSPGPALRQQDCGGPLGLHTQGFPVSLISLALQVPENAC